MTQAIDHTLSELQSRFGYRLERMSYEQKIVMRAALTGFISEKPVWVAEANSITCIDCCIETAGVSWDIWERDDELVTYIQACSELDEVDIEGLIEALTAHIKNKIYLSRSV